MRVTPVVVKYLIKRLLYFIFVFFGVSLLTFTVTASQAGGAAVLGLESGTPFAIRYLSWLRVILSGQPGNMRWQRMGLFAYFGRLVPGTIRLAAVSFIVVIFASVPFGILSAVKKDSVFDYVFRFLTFFGASIPNFSLGFLLLFMFAVRLTWFPVIGEGDLRNMTLPICTLAIPLISRYVRQIRSAVLEELKQDYVAGAMARGISQWRILLLHVMPNTIPSILSFLMILVGQLISSLAVIETVFIWRGAGSLAVSSIRTQDYPIIQAYVLWMAILYICASFIVDAVNHISDPQFIRKSKRAI